jgi:hypothetical protein
MIELNKKLELGKNKNTPEEELIKLLADGNEQVQQATLSNKNFTENSQISLATDVNTPKDILRTLANSYYVVVRNCVAANENCSDELLEEFFNKKDALMGVASNPNTSTEILEDLMDYDKGAYQKFISYNTSVTTTIIEKLSRSLDEDIRVNIASNPTTPENILIYLVNDLDLNVRCKLANNDNTPTDILFQLCKDCALAIKDTAKATLKRKNIKIPYTKEQNKALEKTVLTNEFSVL